MNNSEGQPENITDWAVLAMLIIFMIVCTGMFVYCVFSLMRTFDRYLMPG